MNAHIFTGSEVATKRAALSISELVAEYEDKRAALPVALEAFEAATDALKSAATMRGTWGQVSIDPRAPYESLLADSLLKSAWRHVYEVGGFERIASAEDKRRFDQLFAAPPAFTEENVWSVFEKYRNPRAAILRGMAEVFCQLDPAFRSHERMKIGVKGLPKRVILSCLAGYGSWGRDRLRDILNALAAYQGLPLVDHSELSLAIEHDGEVWREGRTIPDPYEARQAERMRKRLAAKGLDQSKAVAEKIKEHVIPKRGVWLKTFQNGNGHLFFGPEALADINRALAEYYGEVLPDCQDDDARPTKQRASTAVSKDLQYYATPTSVVDRVLAGLRYRMQGQRVLEPSCGCGRFLDALRAAGAEVIGCEVDPVRAAMCEAKGHAVIRANFLETVPTADFDQVIMNPPFYGRHYAKHVRHALRFLKPGGRLTAILPASARYDHGELDDLHPHWDDLPVGSFTGSGTNINTTVATIYAPKEPRHG
ncbi:DUF4942 domain-containing protein [Paracoccus sp. MA]|uniref:DUF4942 domain-containing protein n=1 Tax=Paracoccus sp. MA TaxID=2895796 RepID=UPI001E52092D|nr:DUF4942 domain-containing protein [Paracoccus sp. MA]UFM64272.1 DUF4942 domain-containing protein [Paracoccus sp. MA]